MDVSLRRIVALDVGGTAIKSGMVIGSPRNAAGLWVANGGESGAVGLVQLARSPIDSNAAANVIVQTLVDACHRLIGPSGRATGLAIAFPGPCDYARGIPYLTDFGKFDTLYGCDVKAMITARLASPLPISFVNDAAAAALGEALARQLVGRTLMITLGTGFGSAFLDGAKISRESFPWSSTGELSLEPAFGMRADDVFSIRGLDHRLAAHGTSCRHLAETASQAYIRADIAGELYRFGSDLGTWLAPYITAAKASLLIVGGGLAAYFPWFGPTLTDAVAIPSEAAILGDAAAVIGATSHWTVEHTLKS